MCCARLIAGRAPATPDPTYVWVAGIQQPFGGSDPDDPRGRIVLGGTLKENVEHLNETQLERMTAAILNGCASRFGQSFPRSRVIHVSQCQRPGNSNGFQVVVTQDGRFTMVRGQRGMGIVTAYGVAAEIDRRLAKIRDR